MLISNFTLGFELECICQDRKTLENLYNNIFKNIESNFKMNIGHDETIKINNDIGIYKPLELRSQEFNINLKNISKIIIFLNSLNKNKIYTNESCGFHIHLTFPEYKLSDGYWLLYNLSMNDEMINLITKFKNYNFFNHHASKNILDKFKSNVLSKNNSPIKIEKENIIFLHEKYNTIEWRGPRDFLNKPNLNEIKDFFKLLYIFILWFIKILNKKELNGESKEFWLENYTEMDKFTRKLLNGLKSNDKKYIDLFNNLSDLELIKLIKINNSFINFIDKPSDLITKYINDNKLFFI